MCPPRAGTKGPGITPMSAIKNPHRRQGRWAWSLLLLMALRPSEGGRNVGRRAPASTPHSSKTSLVFFFYIKENGWCGRNWKQKMCNRARSSPGKWAMALGSRGLMSPSAVALEVGRPHSPGPRPPAWACGALGSGSVSAMPGAEAQRTGDVGGPAELDSSGTASPLVARGP